MATAYPAAAGPLPARAGAIDAASNRPLVGWLAACCLLVFAMVVVGGITRLTHSGLSITEWQPIVGALPPMSSADWDEAFAKYRTTPEFRDVNHAMALAEFKGIFWWEYFHRLLGRAIGVAFLVPYVVFAVRRRIPPGYAWPLAGIFVLGGLQGLVGWLMVASGLVDDPRVSPFRLTLHLALAFAIFGAMLWTALSLAFPRSSEHGAPDTPRLRRFAVAMVALVFVMVISGGFVAGIRAGFAYNTFPLMNGHFMPPETFMLDPWWRNFVYNMATVQFDHRLLGWLLAALVPALWIMLIRTAGLPTRARIGGHVLMALAALQIALGIATVLHAAPLPLAAAHQAGAVLVFAAALNVAHALRSAPSANEGEGCAIAPNGR